MAALGAVMAIGTIMLLSATSGVLAAAATSSAESFSVVPVGAPDGLSYFQFHVAPGGNAQGAVSIVGEGTGAVNVNVFAAEGVTANGSGDAYLAPSDGQCSGASCWLTDLPGPLTLTAGQRRNVAFTVNVPAGTPPGQYLTGVGVAEVAPPTTSTTRPTKGRSAVTTIERQVVVGVEVIVGTGYPDELRIEKVSGTRIGNSAGVVVTEAEVGRTIEHPRGAVTLGTGASRRSFPVVSGTVLAGGVTGLRILTTAMKPGTYPAFGLPRLRQGEQSGTVVWDHHHPQADTVATHLGLSAQPGGGGVDGLARMVGGSDRRSGGIVNPGGGAAACLGSPTMTGGGPAPQIPRAPVGPPR